MIPPDDRLECIGGPWDGERVHPGPTGVLAIVRDGEPIGFVQWTPTGPDFQMNEPAIVGLYRIEERPDPSTYNPGFRFRVLRWEPRT